MSYEMVVLSESNKLALKVLRKSLVLIDEIRTDRQRKALIHAKYELSKCVRIYGLIRDFSQNPMDSRWELKTENRRCYSLSDKKHDVFFRVLHKHVSTYHNDSPIPLRAENIIATVDWNNNILNDNEKVILFVVCSLAVEMDKKLKDLERQQYEMRLENKLKGIY